MYGDVMGLTDHFQAGSLLAFIGLACCAIPFVFYFFGARIRQRSRYAYAGDEENSTGKDVQ